MWQEKVKSDRFFGPVIFVISLVVLWWLAGDIFPFSRDEGIILAGGGRVAQGQQPYRDFFNLTGPLSFWIVGLLTKTGATLGVLRLPMILDTAFLVWAQYWIASQFAGRKFAAAIGLAFLAFQSRIPKLDINHRWDSSALAMGAIILALIAHRRNSRALWLLSGCLAAAAAWATPSLLLIGPPLLFWGWWSDRRQIPVFLSGGAIVSALGAAYLQACHALVPMIQAMLWTRANYTAANRMAYGQLVSVNRTGPTFYNIPFSENPLGSLYVILPAILPILAIAGWTIYLWRSRSREQAREIIFLLTAVAALVLSCWPRWSADELFYTAALSTGLCTALAYRLLPERVRPGLCAFLLFMAAVSVGKKVYAASERYSFATQFGQVYGSAEDQELLDHLGKYVHPGDSLFAFPYLAPMYYMLGAHNPTRYNFMQPGMMNAQDESTAIAELSANPPRWVIYEYLPEDFILVLWPGSDRAAIPMTAMNNYLQLNYRDVETVHSDYGRFVVKERIGQAAAGK